MWAAKVEKELECLALNQCSTLHLVLPRADWQLQPFPHLLSFETRQSYPWPMPFWALRNRSHSGHAGRTQCMAICWPVWSQCLCLCSAGPEATEVSNILSGPKATHWAKNVLETLEDVCGWLKNSFPPLSPHSTCLPHTWNWICQFPV